MSDVTDRAEAVRVRSVDRADLLAIHRIEQASFPQPWPYEAFDRHLDAPGFLVAVDAAADGSGDGSSDDPLSMIDSAPVIGYVVGDLTTLHGRTVGHIKDIAVHPDYRGRGVGSTLLERALVRLAGEGTRTVKLEVRASNDPAQSLYRRFGFEPVRTLDGYYADGEDAVVMVRRP